MCIELHLYSAFVPEAMHKTEVEQVQHLYSERAIHASEHVHIEICDLIIRSVCFLHVFTSFVFTMYM